MLTGYQGDDIKCNLKTLVLLSYVIKSIEIIIQGNLMS